MQRKILRVINATNILANGKNTLSEIFNIQGQVYRIFFSEIQPSERPLLSTIENVTLIAPSFSLMTLCVIFSLLNQNSKMRHILNKTQFIYFLFKEDNRYFEKDNSYVNAEKTQEKVIHDLFISVEMFILMFKQGSEGSTFSITT